jgi:hypothetical protein
MRNYLSATDPARAESTWRFVDLYYVHFEAFPQIGLDGCRFRHAETKDSVSHWRFPVIASGQADWLILASVLLLTFHSVN